MGRVRRRSRADLFIDLSGTQPFSSRSLTPAQEAAAIARRKVIYEILHPETRRGAPGVSRQIGDIGKRSGTDRFTAVTAAAIGKPERNIQRAAARGEVLGDDLEAVAGTSLDKGVFSFVNQLQLLVSLFLGAARKSRRNGREQEGYRFRSGASVRNLNL